MNGRFAYSHPLQVVIGDQDLTRELRGGTFSNVDPGGFEACSLSFARPIKAPRPGERITIRYGLEVAWDGRVNDPGSGTTGGTEVEGVIGVGHGAALRDNAMREIYRDIDLDSWENANVARRAALYGNTINVGDWSRGPDGWSVEFDGNTLGSPRLVWELAYRDSSIEIASLTYRGAYGDTFWDIALFTHTAQGSFSSVDSSVLTDFDNSYRTVSAVTIRNGFMFQMDSNNVDVTPVGGAHRTLKFLAAMGNHGLTLRGTEPNAGYYPTDIALHALRRFNSEGNSNLVIEQGPVDTDSNAYACPHAVYLDFVPFERVIDDMVRGQLGWHWGVWEPAGLHATNPRLFLTKPPEQATVAVSRAECGEDFDAPRVRMDAIYNYVIVRYRDASGRVLYSASVIANPLVTQAGVDFRSLVVDAGVSTAAAAATFGQFAMQLANNAARGAGSCTLPGTVSALGGRKPACLVRAGRDRIRITDLPDPGPLHETDTRRFDTFRVRRVETTIQPGGQLDTRVEFDGGADLMEVLAARTQAALVNIGT